MPKQDAPEFKLEYPDTCAARVVNYDTIADNLNVLQQDIHHNAVAHGWWSGEKRNSGEAVALMHSELSEALEAMRAGNPPDDKVPQFSGVEAELADVMIRIMDFAQGHGYRVIEAMIAKHAYNKTRPYKHGGKQF